VLILEDDGSQSILVQALEAGASGFVSKDQRLVELMNAIRVVHQGGTSIPPQMLEALLGFLLGRRRKIDDAHLRLSRLTRREREVLVLLAEGANNDAIAKILVISPETARTHIQNLMSKLGVHSRLQAAAFVTKSEIFQELVKTE
jgi:DNA-binding NarL/FixJ family response regulator